MDKIELNQFLHNIVVNDMDKGKISYDDIMNVLCSALSNTILNKGINEINSGQMALTDLPWFMDTQTAFTLKVLPKTVKKNFDVYLDILFPEENKVEFTDNVVPFNRTLN